VADTEKHARKCVENWWQKRMADPEIVNMPGAFVAHLAEAFQAAIDQDRRRRNEGEKGQS
jgi:hypothetical protein